MDYYEALVRADLSHAQVRRLAGGYPASTNEAVRQRLASLLEPPEASDDPAGEPASDDVRRCGALIVRLGGGATAAVIAGWMGWTMERTTAALDALDRRLDGCGLRLCADADSHITVTGRAALRSRPRRLPVALGERLDAEQFRHGLAHLARGDYCPDGEGWVQPLLDLGAAMTGENPPRRPCELIGAAFVGVWRRNRLPRVVELAGPAPRAERRGASATEPC